MILAQASRTTSLTPWLWVLLALVVVQVLVMAFRHPIRRRLDRADRADPAVRTAPTAFADLAPPADGASASTAAVVLRAATATDWSAVERQLADLVGPAMRALVDERGDEPLDASSVRALADGVARQVAASSGLDAETAEALARMLGDELVDAVPARPAPEVPVA